MPIRSGGARSKTLLRMEQSDARRMRVRWGRA
jgi:hypothetical protein